MSAMFVGHRSYICESNIAFETIERGRVCYSQRWLIIQCLFFRDTKDRFFFYLFFFYCYGDHRDLHSFPTRRSSDLAREGFGESWIECRTRSRRSSYSEIAPRSERALSNSEMSAPAAKASLPAPRKTMQRTAGSRSNSAIAGGMARHMAPLMAFFFAGWLKMSQPTAPRFSTRRLTACRRGRRSTE